MNRFVEAFNAPGWVGLVCNLLLVWASLAASILLLARFGNSLGAAVADGPKSAPWTPPGAVIAGVWCGLYTCMALALWTLNRVSDEAARSPLKWGVALLIAFCLVWPSYAFTSASRWPGLLGNLGILAISVCVVGAFWTPSRAAALLIAPVAVWITVATVTILDGARRYGW